MKANDIPDKSQRKIIPKLLKPQSPGGISFDNPAPAFLSMGTGFAVTGVPLSIRPSRLASLLRAQFASDLQDNATKGLSLPKIPSGLDSHRKAESSHLWER